MDNLFDVAIVGGGINGCGIAADAALRGLSVLLIEKDDIASKTSSSSSKLIHGGLRYLEQYDFSLVKKALSERQTLLNLAPHLIRPQLFILPYQPDLRALWFLRTGLFLYDHLNKANTLPHTCFIWRKKTPSYFLPLNPSFNKGFTFYDCITDDARLTLANAQQAALHKATILTRTTLVKAWSSENIWNITVQNQSTVNILQAKVLINASGPWVNQINTNIAMPAYKNLTLVKGSHIVINPLYQGEQAYFLQNKDKRIIFIIPYFQHTLIGTTDIAYSGNLENIHIDQIEIDYFAKILKDYFNYNLKPSDIKHSWSGVRPLLAQDHTLPQTLSRDYSYQFTAAPAPFLCIYGGKITTYRQLAMEVINQLQPLFPHLPSSLTDRIKLPGAEGYLDYQALAYKRYDWLDPKILTRMLNTYGTHCEAILQDCHKLSDLGQNFNHGLYEKEVRYLIEHEWAQTVEDILWRRTKLGLFLNKDEKQRLALFLASNNPSFDRA